MKKKLLNLKKAGLLLVAFILLNTAAKAAVFTAVASGNWSSSATWGVTAPSFDNTVDQIIIPSGYTVMLDNNLEINGALASVTVNGTLTSSENTTLTVTSGTVAGNGTINLGNIDLEAGAVITFTGSVSANRLTNSAANLQTSATYTIDETLTLNDGIFALQSGGSLTMGNNSEIVVDGGTITNIGGSIGLSSAYNLTYGAGNSVGGLEINGSGLNNLTVNAGAGNSLTLMGNLTVNGTLDLQSGTLALGANSLTIKGNISSTGSGSVSSSGSSNITINSITGTSGGLNFSGSTNSVNNLTIDVGNANNTQIGGTLLVNGTLSLTSGTLNLNSGNLTIKGNIASTGTGKISTSGSSNIVINSPTGTSGTLNFSSSANSINNLTVDVGSSNSTQIGGSVTVNGTLSLISGRLNLNSADINIKGNIAASGSGTVSTSGTSNITISTISGTGGSLNFGTSGSSVNNLTINVGNGSSTGINGNVTVTGDLNLSSGTLNLGNASNLTIKGNIASSGSGTLSSGSGANIVINTAGSPSGALTFANGGSTVNNLTLNITGGGSAMLNSDLTVAGTLNLIKGNLDLVGNNLTLGTSGTINGASSSSYVITGLTGAVSLNVSSANTGGVKFPVGTSASYLPANVTLNSGSGSGKVNIGVSGNVYSNGTSGVDISTTRKVVDATWAVTSDISSNLNMNLKVMWSPSIEVNGFNRAIAYLSHYTNGMWDASANVAASAEAEGMYSISRSGITSLSPFAVFDGSSASIPAVSNEDKFTVYPNPSVDMIAVNTNTTINEEVNMDIVSLSGQIVASYKLNASNNLISVNELNPGYYYIKLYNNQMNSVQRFMKN